MVLRNKSLKEKSDIVVSEPSTTVLRAYLISSGFIVYPSALIDFKSLISLSALFTAVSSPLRNTLFPLAEASILRESSIILRHFSSHPYCNERSFPSSKSNSNLTVYLLLKKHRLTQIFY